MFRWGRKWTYCTTRHRSILIDRLYVNVSQRGLCQVLTAALSNHETQFGQFRSHAPTCWNSFKFEHNKLTSLARVGHFQKFKSQTQVSRSMPCFYVLARENSLAFLFQAYRMNMYKLL